MTSRVQLDVEYDNGLPPVVVVADQRDIVMLEAHLKMGFPAALRDRTVTAIRFLAWTALRRQSLLSNPKLPHAQWEEDVAAVEFEVIDGVDPGKTEAPEGPASSSPSSRVRASGKSANGGRTRT